jgi:hypothetical protein
MMQLFITLLLLALIVTQTTALNYCNTRNRDITYKEHGIYIDIYYMSLPSYNSGTEDCLLNNGATGNGVKALQFNLNDCHGENLSADGKYGELTKAAVVRVQ